MPTSFTHKPLFDFVVIPASLPGKSAANKLRGSVGQDKLNIGHVSIHPGETANLAMPLPEQYSCSPLFMPIKVIRGSKGGPCLLVYSVVKGNELNGMEIINRLSKSLASISINGSIIAIPVMNIYGLTHFPASLPTGDDLTDCFPGDEQGSYGQRMAHLINTEVLQKADVCIEMQTGDLNHNILPQVYCHFDNERATSLAKSFRSPVVTNMPIGDNALHQTLRTQQTPLLVYQAGEALRFDENAIELGIEGVKNVMHAMGMLELDNDEEALPTFSRDEAWIVAHKAGILHHTVSLGQTIEAGETIGTISDPFSADAQIDGVLAPKKGIVVGVSSAPLIHEGQPIFKVASFWDYDKAETAIEEWDKQQPDSYIDP